VDLKVKGGSNLTDDGDASDHGPVTDHGTHVAGIIAGRGQPEVGMRGLAPEIELFSYRVFAHGSQTTDNASIAKAIYKATDDGCDLINLSLGGKLSDVVLSRAIGEAFDKGVVCVVAAGNDHRGSVSYPAWYKRAVAVSALGKRGAFPGDSLDLADVREPYSSSDPDVFVPFFSNVGHEVDFIGPGVAVVSTVPNNGYAVLSGTSMACPAVTGVIAGLMSDNPAILKSTRSLQRSLSIIELVRKTAVSHGLGQMFEGFGLPMP
jgi:subtilisin